MPFKRRNGGRNKKGRGHTEFIRCSNCGRTCPKVRDARMSALRSAPGPDPLRPRAGQGRQALHCAQHRRCLVPARCSGRFGLRQHQCAAKTQCLGSRGTLFYPSCRPRRSLHPAQAVPEAPVLYLLRLPRAHRARPQEGVPPRAREPAHSPPPRGTRLRPLSSGSQGVAGFAAGSSVTRCAARGAGRALAAAGEREEGVRLSGRPPSVRRCALPPTPLPVACALCGRAGTGATSESSPCCPRGDVPPREGPYRPSPASPAPPSNKLAFNSSNPLRLQRPACRGVSPRTPCIQRAPLAARPRGRASRTWRTRIQMRPLGPGSPPAAGAAPEPGPGLPAPPARPAARRHRICPSPRRRRGRRSTWPGGPRQALRGWRRAAGGLLLPRPHAAGPGPPPPRPPLPPQRREGGPPSPPPEGRRPQPVARPPHRRGPETPPCGALRDAVPPPTRGGGEGSEGVGV